MTSSSQGLINWHIPFLVSLVGVYMTLTFNFPVGVGCMVGEPRDHRENHPRHTGFEILTRIGMYVYT